MSRAPDGPKGRGTHIADEEISRLLAQLEENREAGYEKSYAILSTPRVGSNFLCRALDRTGMLGLPTEWFNERIVAEIARRLGWDRAPFRDYARMVVRGSKTPNGIFGVKIHLLQYRLLRERGVDPLSIGFDAVFYVERRDKVAQAYSYAKASRTDVWKAGEIPDGPGEPSRVRRADVGRALSKIVDDIEYFNDHLAEKVTHSFVFEDLIEDGAVSAVGRILQDLELDFDDAAIQPSDLQKQSDAADIEAVERFRRFINGADEVE